MSLIALGGCAGATTGSSSAAVAAPSSATDAPARGSGPVALPTPPVGVPTSQAVATDDPAEAPAADAEPAAAPVLLLEAGGLGVVVDDTRVDQVPFGTTATTVRRIVTRLLGRLTTTRRTDCRQGRRTSSTVDGFELLFDGRHFVGWTDLGAPGRRLTTGDGIGVGITVRALKDSGTDVTVTRVEGGPGGAWTSGPEGLYGRLTAVTPRGRVTAVSSGESCRGD